VLSPVASPPALIRHADPEHARTVVVDWMLGNACNHACSYCPDHLHDGSVRWQPRERVTGFLHRLKAHYADALGRRVWLQFTGGEPTMYPGLVEVLDLAHGLGLHASVISNGSRTRRFWERAIGRLDAVILTYHDEFVCHDAFLGTCAVITAAGRPLHINVTLHPDRFDAIHERALTLRRACPQASITLKPLRVGFGAELYGYTPHQIERLARGVGPGAPAGATTPRGIMVEVAGDGTERRRRPNDFILADTNRWRGYRCEAGVESLRVKGDGEVMRAVCGVGRALGRLGEDFALPTDGVICPRDRCSCIADILVTKRRVAPDRSNGAA
jgi:pyruvate-formate lyase-activating enzyme